MTLTVDNSPALRFLDRGQQLLRLQARIAARILQELEEGQSAVKGFKLEPAEDVAKFLEFVGPDQERFVNRLSDIGLMLQLFLSRYVDNFQGFVDELLRDIYRAKPDILKRQDVTVSMKDVLSHASIDAFIETAIER